MAGAEWAEIAGAVYDEYANGAAEYEESTPALAKAKVAAKITN